MTTSSQGKQGNWSLTGVGLVYPGRKERMNLRGKENLPQMLKSLVELFGKQRGNMRRSDSGWKNFTWVWTQDRSETESPAQKLLQSFKREKLKAWTKDSPETGQELNYNDLEDLFHSLTLASMMWVAAPLHESLILQRSKQILKTSLQSAGVNQTPKLSGAQTEPFLQHDRVEKTWFPACKAVSTSLKYSRSTWEMPAFSPLLTV